MQQPQDSRSLQAMDLSFLDNFQYTPLPGDDRGEPLVVHMVKKMVRENGFMLLSEFGRSFPHSSKTLLLPFFPIEALVPGADMIRLRVPWDGQMTMRELATKHIEAREELKCKKGCPLHCVAFQESKKCWSCEWTIDRGQSGYQCTDTRHSWMSICSDCMVLEDRQVANQAAKRQKVSK